MPIPLWAAAVFAPLFAVALDAPTPEGDFCPDLMAVLDAEPQEFSSIRGRYDRDMLGYLSRVQIEPEPDGETCWIDRVDAQDPWAFTCIWRIQPPAVDQARARARDLSSRVEACLKASGRRFLVRTPWTETPPGRYSTRSSRDLGGGSATLTVQGASTAHDVEVRSSGRCTESVRRGTTSCSVHLSVEPAEVY